MLGPVRALGAFTLWVVRLVGALVLVAGRTLLHLGRMNKREALRSTMLFGWESLPLSLGVATLIGATVVMQAGVYAEKYGARQYTGWAAGYALMWEFGPLLLGIVMAARIGARNAAELALLNINGQIEGLRGISLDPFRLLVVPRVVASAFSVFCLTSVTFIMAIFWEAVASYFTLHLPLRVFFGAFADMLRWTDLAGGMTKSFAYGIAIALVSTTVGLRAEGGARGVGRAAASAVVASCAAIFVLDQLLTNPLEKLFN